MNEKNVDFSTQNKINIKAIVGTQITKVLQSLSMISETPGEFKDEQVFINNVDGLYFLVSSEQDTKFNRQITYLVGKEKQKIAAQHYKARNQAYYTSKVNLAKQKFMIILALLSRINWK